jgi:hypothetical protein
MKKAYFFYEAPMYWRKYPDIPCLTPDLVVYQNIDRTAEMFRWPRFLRDRFPSRNLKTIEHLGETYEIYWAEDEG